MDPHHYAVVHIHVLDFLDSLRRNRRDAERPATALVAQEVSVVKPSGILVASLIKLRFFFLFPTSTRSR